MKNMKRVIAVLLTMVMAFSCAAIVSAAEPVTTEEGQIQPRMTYLTNPTAAFEVRAAYGQAELYTGVVNSCSKVTFDVTMQYYNGSKWIDVSGSSQFYEVDTHNSTYASAHYTSNRIWDIGNFRLKVVVKGHWGIFWETKEIYSNESYCYTV